MLLALDLVDVAVEGREKDILGGGLRLLCAVFSPVYGFPPIPSECDLRLEYEELWVCCSCWS